MESCKANLLCRQYRGVGHFESLGQFESKIDCRAGHCSSVAVDLRARRLRGEWLFDGVWTGLQHGGQGRRPLRRPNSQGLQAGRVAGAAADVKFELLVNLKTARQIGATIPQSVLISRRQGDEGVTLAAGRE